MQLNGHVKGAAKGTPYVVVTVWALLELLVMGGFVQSRQAAELDPRVARALEMVEDGHEILTARDDEGIPQTWWPRRHGPVMQETLDNQKETVSLLKQQVEILRRIEHNGRGVH